MLAVKSETSAQLRRGLLSAYRRTRSLTLQLVAPLEPEDFRIQSMEDVSPPWWNLGHTSWFFARNILKPFGRYLPQDERLEYVMNSYYEALGERVPRAERGLVTRPTTQEVLDFRQSVDERLESLILEAPEGDFERLHFLVTTGIQHEQQHQELLVTEMKHILGSNVRALRRPYQEPPEEDLQPPVPFALRSVPGGLIDFGHSGEEWAWDNERPTHRAFLTDFRIANRLATNGEFMEFVEDGGYRSPLLWLANGWERVQEEGWSGPLYWEKVDGRWQQWTLGGDLAVDAEEPVCHVSFYEADAFLRWKGSTDGEWKGARLPTEREWEHSVRCLGFDTGGGNLLDDLNLHPRRARGTEACLDQAAGDLWEWTSSHYEAYPAYRPFAGDLMEYNGKFMDNQRVLRGGSCATPRNHIRATYRNFWHASTRFQLTGIRAAADA